MFAHTILYFVREYGQHFMTLKTPKNAHFPSPLGPSLRPLLKRIGLDEKEAEVYLALLPLKKGRVTDIAKAAGQSRSHTYPVLRSLEKKGLVSELEQGKIIHFVAEPAHRLLMLVEDREREARELLPLVEGALPFLQSLSGAAVGRPRVTLSHGLDGMKQVYRDLLKEDFVGMMNVQAMYDTFGKSVPELLFGPDVQLKGRDLLVDNGGARRYCEESNPSDVYSLRILPKDVKFVADTIVFGDTIALFSFDEEKTIVRLENRNLADAFRAWFEVMWSASREP